MKSRSSRARLLLAVFILAAACHAQDKAEGAKWQVISPPASGFTIQMPGKPKEQLKDATAKGGVHIAQHLFLLESDNVDYYAMYTEYPINLSGSERSMDEYRESFLAGFEGKLVSEQSAALNGLHGRIVRAISNDGKAAAYLRLYVGKRRLYEFLIVQPKDIPFGADAERFFSSLQFVPLGTP